MNKKQRIRCGFYNIVRCPWTTPTIRAAGGAQKGRIIKRFCLVDLSVAKK